MIKMKLLYVSFLVLALMISESQCLQCYQCTDFNEGPCFNPKESNLTTESCPFSCYMKQYTDDGVKTVKRNCDMQVAIDHDCEILHKDKEISVDFCTSCKEDGCNSAVTASLSTLSLIFAFVVSITVA